MRLLRNVLYLVLAQTGFAGAFGSKKADPQEPERVNPGELPMTETSKKSPAVEGQYLISFEASVTDSQRAALFAQWNVTELEKVGSTPLYLIEVPRDSNLEKTLAGLRSGRGVRYVEANLKMQTFGP